MSDIPYKDEQPKVETSSAATVVAEDNGLLTLDKLRTRYPSRQKRVRINELDADIVVQKLPARIIENDRLGELSPMVLALTEGVAEPKITEDMINAMSFEEANAIFTAVEKFNPGVLGSDDDGEAAERRKSFPA